MASDLAHWWQNDLSVAASGDLLSVDGTTKGEQRIVRRLLTPPGSYYFHKGYGAGLAQYIGQPTAAETIKAIIRQQLRLEAAVARTPDPQISVVTYATGVVTVTIVYTDADTGRPVTLSFDINK